MTPSRVIIWTTPYKQLYKDPAVLVALHGRVEQIDKVVGSSDKIDESMRQRIETAINDADSKYTDLWKLYVFISDGLYYSGVLNKLLKAGGSRPSNRDDLHLTRLKNARVLLSCALKAVCENWRDLHPIKRIENDEIETLAGILQSDMKSSRFKSLIGRWVGDFGDRCQNNGDGDDVDIEHYYHEYALDDQVDPRLKRPCRDIRYKYDVAAREARTQASGDGLTESSESELIKFLKKCGIADPAPLSESELRGLTVLYSNNSTRTMCDALVNQTQNDPGNKAEALKALFLDEFDVQLRNTLQQEQDALKVTAAEPQEFPAESLLPLQQKQDAPKVSAPVVELVNAAEVLQTKSEFEKWLWRDTRILAPRVRKALMQEAEAVHSVLQNAATKYPPALVLEDFEYRILNESKLKWNEVKPDRVIEILGQRWKLTQDLAKADDHG